jgi:hypothetical protein
VGKVSVGGSESGQSLIETHTSIERNHDIGTLVYRIRSFK